VRVGQHRAARAELQAMLRAATQRRFDMVVFWALDRLTRDVPKRGGFGTAEMAPNDGASPAQGIERVHVHRTGGGFGIVGRLTQNATKI